YPNAPNNPNPPELAAPRLGSGRVYLPLLLKNNSSAQPTLTPVVPSATPTLPATTTSTSMPTQTNTPTATPTSTQTSSPIKDQQTCPTPPFATVSLTGDTWKAQTFVPGMSGNLV